MQAYIQYINKNGNIKAVEVQAQEIDLEDGFPKVQFILPIIQEQFFILTVFFNNKRVLCLEFVDVENLDMLAFLNSDFQSVDAIPETAFFNAYQEIILQTDVVVAQNPSIVSVDNFPSPSFDKFFKEYDCPIYRGNVYGLTNQSLGGEWSYTHWISRNVFRKNSGGTFVFFHNQSFDNFRGNGPVPTDWGEQRVLDMTKTHMVNGMYVKFSVNTPSVYDQFININFFQDVRTNEVYISWEKGSSLNVYNWFSHSSKVIVDGGFSVEDVDLGIKIEVRNKFF